LKTELTGNMTRTINTFTIPILIILNILVGKMKWSDTDLEALNTPDHNVTNRIHHIHTLSRFILDREEGRRGFIDIKNLNYKQLTT